MADCGLEHLLIAKENRSLLLPGLRSPLPVSERGIRRIITLISILALIVLAVTLVLHFASQYASLYKSSRQQLDMLMRLSAQGLDRVIKGGDTVRAPLSDDLQRVLPDYAFAEGRIFLIVESDGIIRAIAGRHALAGLILEEGSYLPEFLHRFLTPPEGGMISSVSLEDGSRLMVGTIPLHAWPGSVLALQPQASIAALWTKSAGLLSSLFIGLFIIMVGLISVYNWQAAQAEEDTRERGEFIERLETALMLGRCGLWDWDVARGRIYLSASMRWLLGLPLNTDSYMDLADFIALQHPQEHPLDVLLEKGLEEGRQTFEHELRLRRADGKWLWLKMRGALPTAPRDGYHLVGIGVDITAQKRATAAVRSAEQRLAQAIEAISESFVLWDRHMRMIMCNSKFRELHGLSEEACREGRTFAEIMRAAENRIVNRHSYRVFGDGMDQETVMEVELANGRWLQISERYMPGGGFVSVGTDITELKNKQIELENSRIELQKTVEALELSQKEIESQNVRLNDLARRAQLAKEKAEEALRIKSQFLANVSHELFTPLTHIISSADAMRQQAFGPLGEHYLSYAEMIHGAGEEVKRKINDILEYAQLTTGEVKLEKSMVRISALMAQVVEEFLPAAQKNGISLSWHGPEGLEAKVDEQRLLQVLRQLVSNAVRFTEKGGVSIRAEAGEKGALLIEVRDSGRGIPKDRIARIGKPFERAGDAYNAHKGGSGIGLAIALTVVEMHGGTMQIESEEGRGTRVRIILPNVALIREPSRESLRAAAHSS